MIGLARQPLLFAALLIPASLMAGTVNLGVFLFDNLVPDGATPRVNVFDISNSGGASDLPPGLPKGIYFQIGTKGELAADSE